MPAGKEVQPECISQRASSGRLNCSCSRSRDLTAINPVVPEMMKIAALAVSTAPGGNMSFAFSKSVPIAPAKGRGKRTCAMRLCRRENGKGHIAIPKQPKTAF